MIEFLIKLTLLTKLNPSLDIVDYHNNFGTLKYFQYIEILPNNAFYSKMNKLMVLVNNENQNKVIGLNYDHNINIASLV